MARRSAAVLVLAALAVSLAASRSHAGLLSEPQVAGFSPRVPLSAFARPASWFDPSRLHLSSVMSVGTGFAGGTQALNVTSLSYQFRAPLTLRVALGNSFGLDGARKGSAFFLEGVDLTWRPNRNSIFRVEMHDVRSPLQYGNGYRGYGNPGYGPVDPFLAPY